MAKTLAWGILGTGGIARVFARGVAESGTGRVLAVGSRTYAAAERFAEEFSLPRQYGSYDELLTDKDVQAIYVALPHSLHAEWAVKAAEAGKHVLCEKPIGLNYDEAREIVEAAIRNDVFLMEAFMYRCHPQTAKLVELIQDGAIGKVRLVEATFGFDGGSDPEGRLMNKALGGGGILDVGCYPVSLARLVAGVAMGTRYADPTEVLALGHLGPTGVDEYAIAMLKFPGDLFAQVSCSIRLGQENGAWICGTEGRIHLPTPWGPSREGGTSKIILHRAGEPGPREIDVVTTQGLYAIEAEAVASYLEARQAPFMTWDDTFGNMKTLDRWRALIGLSYPTDLP